MPTNVPADLSAEERVAQLEARIREYHRTELSRWADSVAETQLHFEKLEAVKQTVSWRITAPLRAIRRSQLER